MRDSWFIAMPLVELTERSETHATDRALAKRISHGESLALAEAYDAHHAVARALARRLMGNSASAEDLVHDAFVALPNAARAFEGRSSLRTFILSVVVNQARNARRATARRLRVVDEYELLPTQPSESPEAREERRQLGLILLRLLDALPMEQRLVVVLCLVEERTSTEVAEIMGIPEATVRTRLFHARQKLRDGFEKEQHP